MVWVHSIMFCVSSKSFLVWVNECNCFVQFLAHLDFHRKFPVVSIPQISHIVCRIDQMSLHMFWLHTPLDSRNTWLHPSISFGRVPQISLGHIPPISLVELDTSLKFPIHTQLGGIPWISLTNHLVAIFPSHPSCVWLHILMLQH